MNLEGGAIFKIASEKNAQTEIDANVKAEAAAAKALKE